MAPNSSNTTITTTSLDEDMAELGPQSSRRSFRDFPAEVRNKIYFYALIDDYVTGIIRRSGTIRSQPHVDWPSFYGKASSELGARINTSLLRVSTTISQEATPILYGNHVFLIRNPNHFLDWVKMIGIKNAACVRMLRLEYTSICRGMFLEVLPSYMPQLARLEIPHSTLWNPKELARDLWLLVRTMPKNEDSIEQARKVVQTLAFYTPNDARDKYITANERAERYGNEVEAELMLIAQELRGLAQDEQSGTLRVKSLAQVFSTSSHRG